MYDPPAPQPSGNEWVEVLNVTGGPLDAGGLVVADASASSDPVPAGTTVAAGGFLVLVNDGDAFGAAYPGVPFVEVGSFPTLNNGGDRPALVFGAAEIDAVPYQPGWGGADASLERRDPARAERPGVQLRHLGGGRDAGRPEHAVRARPGGADRGLGRSAGRPVGRGGL